MSWYTESLKNIQKIESEPKFAQKPYQKYYKTIKNKKPCTKQPIDIAQILAKEKPHDLV